MNRAALNRSSVVTVVVWLDQLAAVAKAKRQEFAAMLDAEARAEYAEQGMASTWRFPDVASVSSRVSHASVRVADEAAFLAWVQEHHPDKVETVVRVKPGWQSRFFDEVLESAQTPPGLEYVPGGRFAGVSITATHAAKQALGMLAEQGLRLAALDAGSLVAPAFAELEAGPDNDTEEQSK